MPKRKRTRSADSGGDKRREIVSEATPQAEEPYPRLDRSCERSTSIYPNETYTVGWVCALSVELAAAKGMLDETHGEPRTQPNGDHNAYTLGRIHEFNVVIACLPASVYGTSSAANLVGAMWTTFPSLKIGFFVGIGAGIPFFAGDFIRDIRLGDVVVGTSVVDYEMRKKYDGDRVLSTGHQDKPSRILLAAIQRLRADNEDRSSRSNQYIDDMIQNHPDKGHFAYRASMTDQLCEPCLLGSNCTGNKNVTVARSRPDRPHGDAMIHYGTIASGNTLCRDRAFREEIREKFDAICFDMEAAGVMNNFSGLVVRGISDYADCHKNDDWQSYAAASAAGYVKLLMSYVPLNVKHTGTLGHGTVRPPEHGVEEIKVLDWISKETLESRHVDYLNRLQPDTGDWFLSSSEFKDFVNGDEPLLFCPGMPGAGKTMISTLAIDFLRRECQQDPAVAVCFLYFDYRIKYNNVTELVAIILRQLAAHRLPLAKPVRSLYELYGLRNSKPPLRDYISTLQSALSEWKKVFLVVDAIDECPSSNSTRQTFLGDLNTIQANSKLRIMITGRPNPDVVDVMRSRKAKLLEIRARDEDVETYIADRIRKSDGLARQPEVLQQLIKAKITQAVDGMFLLAQLYLDRVSHLRIHRDIEDAIATLRQGSDAYEEAFSAAMDRIDRQQESNKEIAKKALAWITYATRPLETKELQHALALRPTDTVIYETGMPDVDHILSVCVGLVTWDEMSRTFKLVHYTAQQYLEGSLGRWFPDAKLYIAKTCLQYLSLNVFDGEEWTEYFHRALTYYLYTYAVHNLAYHLRHTSSQLDSEIMHFLIHRGRINAFANELLSPADKGLDISPFHVAAALDLDEIIAELLNDGWDVNAEDGISGSSLVWAARAGSAKTVRRLLKEKNVKVNALAPVAPSPKIRSSMQLPDTPLMSPLMMACKYGHEDAVATLLADTRVDLNAVDSMRRTALHYACIAYRISTNSWGRSEVHHVCSDNRTSIIALLVQTSPVAHDNLVLDPVDITGHTPLYVATSHGNVDAMKILLDTGRVAVDKKVKYGETPLLCASQRGDTEAVFLLLQHGADPRQGDDYGGTPLQYAARGNHEDVVRMLLQPPKADSLALDKFGRSALYEAAGCGAVSIVRMLLTHQQRDQEYYGTDEEQLLEKVSSDELEKITQLIRAGRIHPDAKGQYEYIIYWAVQEGHLGVTKALLDVGARFKAKRFAHRASLLSTAAFNGHIELVRLLLSRGHDPTFSTMDGEAPIHYAVSKGHYEIARLLLQETTAADVPKKITLLADAAGKEDGRFLELLIEHGCDPNDVDSYGQTAFRHAVKSRSATAMKRLLEKGASCDLADEDTLELVKQSWLPEILQLLQAE